MVSESSVSIISKCTVFPHQKSNPTHLQLSVSDLPMLSCHYIQKGGLFSNPPFPISHLLSLLKRSLSLALSRFPPLAGRLTTAATSRVYLHCNDAGVDFIHANASHLRLADLLGSTHGDVPESVKTCFAFDHAVSYDGHFRPLLAVQVTELYDGVFIACSVNHAVADGTSFWNFFNTFADLSRGVKSISRLPEFSRDSALISPVVLRFPEGGPKVTFSAEAPVRERIFSFSRESILKLKAKVNGDVNVAEVMGKQANDTLIMGKEKPLTPLTWLKNAVSGQKNPTAEISSFQSLCALLWRGITRARLLPAEKTTTFRMAVNCRHRMEPEMAPLYFGNAIQSVATSALAGEVVGEGMLRRCAEKLSRTVAAHGDGAVRKYVEDWEREPRCFPLGNPSGTMVMMGSSPRFPMYDNDFGWGTPLAVRSGRNNKFDGKISAFPGREGGGSVDLEVILSPHTMAGLESDPEFMHYVSM